MSTPFIPILSSEDVTATIIELAETIHDGWYTDEQRIDWAQFIDRLESWGHYDFGSSMESPAIKTIKKHIRNYRNNNN